MAQGSSSSGSSSHGGGGAGYDGQGSPVPYRVGPLAYEPTVLCDCRMKACRWTSWSDAQPGRRYLRCRKSKTAQDCKFYRRVDVELDAWYKQLLKDLRDEVWKLKKVVDAKDIVLLEKQRELELKMKEAEEVQKMVEEMQLAVEVKQQELNAKGEELLVKQVALDAKDVALQAMQGQMKRKDQYFDALLVMCVVLVILLVVCVTNGK